VTKFLLGLLIVWLLGFLWFVRSLPRFLPFPARVIFSILWPLIFPALIEWSSQKEP
jgi:hypothetical protein